ncbi:hypothetical protein BH09PAT1_BH09PAT1_2610 [soil metagenome]
MSHLDELKIKALSLMEAGGYPIKEEISLEVDEKLPFMGYTTERNGKTVIVIAGWSLKSEMSLGLTIHELSHVYRIETSHPSHNQTLHNRVLVDVLKGRTIYPYQKEILFNILNTIQDLYADDISFKVYIKEAQKENLSDFFLSWVHPVINPVKTDEDIWKNAETLVNAAFAKANLKRHDVLDKDDKVKNAIAELLENISREQASQFNFFVKLMVGLPEEVNDEEFKEILAEYISAFLKVVV